MLKDAGNFTEALRHYSLALEKLPHDADLAAQIGHLYKLGGELEPARLSYERALILRPQWPELIQELSALNAREPLPLPDTKDRAWLVPELLPSSVHASARSARKRLHLSQLGRPPERGSGGKRVLRGTDAVRGYWISTDTIEQVRLLVDGKVVIAEPPVTYSSSDEGDLKHVFNLWHDFSQTIPGPHAIELIFADAAGQPRFRHIETLYIGLPLNETNGAASDAWVAPRAASASLKDAINALPSVVRPVGRHLLPENPRNILVLRADQLGDLVCSVPAIQRLRSLFVSSRLVGLVTPANAAFATSLALFDEVLTVDFAEDPNEGRRILDVAAQARLRDLLTPYAFDVAIDLGEGDDSRPLLLLSGAKFLYGFRHRQFPWLDAGLDFGSHDPVNRNDVVPPSRKFVLLVDGLAGMMHNAAKPLRNENRAELANLNIAPGDRYAVLHAGARLFFSRWPNFDRLANLLLERTDLKIILLSPDSGIANRLDYGGRLQIINGQLPFAQLDALVSHCAIFVGNDSGPKHLAALRGAPVVSIHIPRNNWSEWGQEISGTIISRRVPCAGCGIAPDGEDCGKDFACIRKVTPEEVYAAIAGLLPASAN